MTVAVVGLQTYCVNNGIAYYSSLNENSLLQWAPLCSEMRLFLTRISCASVPAGWVPIGSRYKVYELATADVNRWRLRQVVRANARRFLRNVALLYVRGCCYESFWTAGAAKGLGIPILYEMHGDWQNAILNEGRGSRWRRCTRRVRASIAKAMQARLAAMAVAVISVGPTLAEKYVPKGVPTLISTNNNIHEAQLRRRVAFTLKDPPRLLFVGEIKHYKGLRYLFEALRILWEGHQRFEMILVGEGPFKNSLAAYATNHGFREHVHFTGYLPFCEVIDHYRTADVFILPSLTEGVPRVIQEAMSVGCPVIASDVGSIRWQLEEGAGLLVPPGDPRSLANAITTMLQNESVRRSLSARSYIRAQAFSFEKQSHRIRDFVKSQFPVLCEKPGLHTP
jgi:glycosyltransferase involved in cell wall biosynthesis